MPSYKITYFNGRGRAEISRLIFTAAGVEFTDERVTNWPAGKEDAPLGQLPYLTVDDVKLPQSASIARFLANRFNLSGKDDLEKAKADVIVDTINDLLNSYYNKVFSVPESQRVEARTKYLADEGTKHVANIDKLIKLYGSNGHSVGTGLTWADLFIMEVAQMVHGFDANILNNYHNILAVKKTIEEHPKIASYLKSRPVTPF